jgi:hypothetical protein
VHGFPSSHAAALPVNTQPEAGLHESAVHATPSLHESGPPPTHAPATHASPTVQAFPSLHDSLLGKCTQPEGPQESSVHGLPSSHPAAC